MVNKSHVVYKWLAHLSPNDTAINKLYREKYEGRDRNMTICMPLVMGAPYPDWATREYILSCENYVPENYAHVYHLKDIGFVYNKEKPLVDVFIGLGTVKTALGVRGKLLCDRVTPFQEKYILDLGLRFYLFLSMLIVSPIINNTHSRDFLVCIRLVKFDGFAEFNENQCKCK